VVLKGGGMDYHRLRDEARLGRYLADTAEMKISKVLSCQFVHVEIRVLGYPDCTKRRKAHTVQGVEYLTAPPTASRTCTQTVAQTCRPHKSQKLRNQCLDFVHLALIHP
jgi:hypothetical protein